MIEVQQQMVNMKWHQIFKLGKDSKRRIGNASLTFVYSDGAQILKGLGHIFCEFDRIRKP